MNPIHSGLAAAGLWSVTALLVALLSNIPPFQIMALTWAIAVGVLAVFFSFKGGMSAEQFRRPVQDYFFVLGGIGGYTILYYFAFKTGPAFEVNALNYLWPILIVVFIDISERKLPDKRQLAGMMTGFVGCITLLAAKSWPLSFGGLSYAHLMAVSMAVIWALYSCVTRNKNYPPAFMVPVFLILTVFFAVMHLAIEKWVAPSFNEWLIIIFLGFTDISFILWDYSMKKGNRILITSFSYFIPLFSTMFLVLGGFGTANNLIFLAAGLIIAGCIIVNSRSIFRALNMNGNKS
ncbi:MAG TPA: EamA family transporter [Alphaproteobacteria bacterium]|jgi:drug/metabolite transporter (DMT)-like permease|nr:EamA family transporter [Alphaproteobacteria bacterium]